VLKELKKWIKKMIFDRGWVIFVDLTSTAPPSLDFKKFKSLLPPRDRFWADPFVISRDDKHYIFLEEFIWKTNKGHISCLVLNSKGETEQLKIILEQPYHLSYPFVFEANETLYLIPESSANKTIDLYECINFPFEWKFKQSLLQNIDAVDSTIYFHRNRYWLFCGVKNDSSIAIYDNLSIFYSDNLLGGNWTPHPKNPVVSDIQSARPAGSIFDLKGMLLRPSQIGVPYYGYGLAVNQITELNENNFSEKSYRIVRPDWRKGLGSVHTLNFSNQATVTDGVFNRFRRFT
jgi:hypothetical protein